MATRKMNITIWGFIGVFLISVCLMGFVTQAGAEILKWRQTLYVSKVDRIEVGDVPGHILGVGEGGGVAFFEKGEVATYTWKATLDYVNGVGPSQGYEVYTFEDGSTFLYKYEVVSTAEGKTFRWKGTFSFMQGSGRFAGIQGGGSFTGKRVGGPASGTQGYLDYTATYTLPPK